MLLHRVLTASVLAAVVIWLMLYQPTDVFVYLLFVVAFTSGFEWARLGGIKSTISRIAFAFFVTLIAWFFIEFFYKYAIQYALVSTIWWFAMLVYLRHAVPTEKSVGVLIDKLAIAILVIPAAAISMYAIHRTDQGPQWLLYSLVLVWIADTGAYFAGKKFGKKKLAPKISPGKTREGLFGAMLATAIYTFIAGNYFGLEMDKLILLLILSFVLTLVSVAGDLYESLLKREAGLKDSGVILPGHGGMLDRIDSVLAAMPVFLVGFNWLIYPVEGL
jgi:phosphatidate cytidylyltransferase